VRARLRVYTPGSAGLLAVLSGCGLVAQGRLVMPSTAEIGQSRPVIASCVCGAEVEGRGVVVEVLG